MWWPAVPLGIPGEWTWSRIPPDTAFGIISGTAIVATVAAIYLLYAWAGAKRLPQCGRFEAAAWLGGLVMIAFAWLWNVQQSQPVGYGMSKVAWVLYYPGSSGYFHEALYGMDDTGAFLASYESRMEQGDVLHVGTHPPGLFLFHKFLISVCRRFPGFCESLNAAQPQSVRLAFQVLALNAEKSGHPVRATGLSALWLAAMVTQIAAVAAIVPLYRLLRFWHPRQTAWKAVTFWPLIPALAIFLPKSDALFPLIAFGFLYLWVKAVRDHSIVCSALSGLTLWLAMWFSLAFLPIALIAVIYAFVGSRTTDGNPMAPGSWKPFAIVPGAAVFVFLTLTVFAAIVLDINLARVWILNFQNHSGFYEHYSRTWWKWLLVNPLELAVAVGVPLAVLAVYSVARIIQTDRLRTHGCVPLIYTSVLVWAVLWIWGKNMGEAARLWIVMMPIVVFAVAVSFSSQRDHADDDQSEKSQTRNWILLLALQAAVCASTTIRVDGFDLSRAMARDSRGVSDSETDP